MSKIKHYIGMKQILRPIGTMKQKYFYEQAKEMKNSQTVHGKEIISLLLGVLHWEV